MIDIENATGNWVAVAKSPGSAVIIVSDGTGGMGSVTLTVESAVENVEIPASSSIDLSANMDVRQEMIRLINQVRRENGVGELTINDALMNAAQDCCETAMAYGYPHGFGSNLTVFAGTSLSNTPRQAVQNWVNSRYHFQTMVTARYDTIGVGIFEDGQCTYCYTFAGDPNSRHPYE